jgi:3'(2'), 5'-bisphosphate nucleotidase
MRSMVEGRPSTGRAKWPLRQPVGLPPPLELEGRSVMDKPALLTACITAAREAGAEILKLVAAGFEVEHKGDLSPVTVCDRAAEAIILAALAKAAPDVPVIAEEEVAAGRIPAHGDTYFLVDPLDGTKEFVRGGEDYTVNIGLIEGGSPTLGVVYQPATDKLWAGVVGEGAFVEDEGQRHPIATRALTGAPVAVASKSHYSQPTDDYLAAVGAGTHVSVGSSLKFCIVAEGEADIYPRLSPTSEWDTAAGHAILLAAGGRVDGPDGAPLAYGKTAFLNRAFCATAGWEAPPVGRYMEEFSGGGDLPQGV